MTSARVTPPRTRAPGWMSWWGIGVWGLLCIEFIWGGFPDRPEGVSWMEARGPLIPVGVGVMALVVLAAVQAKWGKRGAWESSNLGGLGLGRCPAWFGYTALGLGVVGAVLYAYAGFRSLGGDGSVHLLQRRGATLLLIGSYVFFLLISWVSGWDREDAEAWKGDSREGIGEVESRSELAPFRRRLGIVYAALYVAMPGGAFIAFGLASGRGGFLGVALAVLLIGAVCLLLPLSMRRRGLRRRRDGQA